MPPGPGGLGEFEQLPPEVRRLVIEAMPPESLQRFSEASASVKQEVDLYVKDLVRDEVLRDLGNRPVKEVGGFDPDCIHLPSIYVNRLILGAPYDKKIEFRTVREREVA